MSDSLDFLRGDMKYREINMKCREIKKPIDFLKFH